MGTFKTILSEVYLILSRPLLLALVLSGMNLAGYHDPTVIMFLETVMFMHLAFYNFDTAKELNVSSSLLRLLFDIIFYLGTSAGGIWVIEYFKVQEEEYRLLNTSQVWDAIISLLNMVAGPEAPAETGVKGWLGDYYDLFHGTPIKAIEREPWVLWVVTAGIPYLHMVNVISLFRISTLTIDLLCYSGEAYFAPERRLARQQAKVRKVRIHPRRNAVRIGPELQ